MRNKKGQEESLKTIISDCQYIAIIFYTNLCRVEVKRLMAKTLDVFKLVKKKIEDELKLFNLTLKSAGTKQEELTVPLNEETGYWEDPNSVTSKPPRWIVQFEKIDNNVIANFARKPDGEFFPSAKTIGYVNNREGNCAVMVFRVYAAIKNLSGGFVFPSWEWLMVLTFTRPLPAGTSGESINNFNPVDGTIVYHGKCYHIASLGIVPTPVDNLEVNLDDNNVVTYEEATAALKSFLENGNEVE